MVGYDHEHGEASHGVYPLHAGGLLYRGGGDASDYFHRVCRVFGCAKLMFFLNK